jgi:hypothetical protein
MKQISAVINIESTGAGTERVGLRPPGDGRRIRVSAITRALIDGHERSVLVVGLSSRTALFVTEADDMPESGSVLSLYLPGVAGEIEVVVGVDWVEKVPQGFAVAVSFMVSEQVTRQALNDLMRLLLAGDGGGARAHPRVIYDTPIRYGPMLTQSARLGELSLRGAGIRMGEQIAAGESLSLSIPDFSSATRLVLKARVVHQCLSREGGYETGVEFDAPDEKTRTQLTTLLADLLCR